MSASRTAAVRDRHWSADVPASAWDAALAVLRGARARGKLVVLACHTDPDGDALGSLLALHRALASLGVEAVASWGSRPFQVPAQYTFLPGLDRLVPPQQVPPRPDVLVTLDAASPGRLGSLRPLLDAAGTVIVVDHHASNEGFGDVNLIAPRAAATAMLVDELIRRLGADVDREIATCLYVGLVTDTARFQHRSTDSAAMELGSRLLGHDIAHERLNRQMFGTHSFGYLKLLGQVLGRAQLVPEAGLVHAYVTQDDLERHGVALEETEGIIDLLSTAVAAEVGMLLKETPEGRWRVSLRATGSADVGALAARLDGGGHAFSAGFTADGDRDAVVAAVVERLR